MQKEMIVEATGTVLEIQRMSTEDGPGIRTTLFMKGCPLGCRWCHNPESISPKQQVHWIGSRCIGCGHCIEACPKVALRRGEKGIEIDRDLCRGCGACAEACPSTAMELMGREWEVRRLAEELKKDRSFFEKSGGGITVSGGESTLQSDFVAALLRLLKEEGIHTAIDTCGLCGRDTMETLLPFVDLVLYDIKEIDPSLHRDFTGSTNERILSNLGHLCAYMRDHIYPREIWVRTPIIPGATDREDNILGIGRFIASLQSRSIVRWELCAFNNLCRDKYARLGRTWEFAETQLMEEDSMERLADIARGSGVRPEIVSWTGSTRQKRGASDETTLHNNKHQAGGCPSC
jgi:pyruvate formate lyase activating enzyme